LYLFAGHQPAFPEDAPGLEYIVALGFSVKAFQPARFGVAKANKISSGKARQTGRATWFRAVSSDGKPVFDGTVGMEDDKDASLRLNETGIEVDAIVEIKRFSYMQHQSKD
jgi:hypothetical protein